MTDLVEVENQIEFTNIPEKLVQYFDKKVDGFQICKLIIVCVNADTEEEPSISSVDNLGAG